MHACFSFVYKPSSKEPEGNLAKGFRWKISSTWLVNESKHYGYWYYVKSIWDFAEKKKPSNVISGRVSMHSVYQLLNICPEAIILLCCVNFVKRETTVLLRVEFVQLLPQCFVTWYNISCHIIIIILWWSLLLSWMFYNYQQAIYLLYAFSLVFHAACDPGTFGPNCPGLCTCKNNATCSTVDGACTCTAGYRGSDCGQSMLIER